MNTANAFATETAYTRVDLHKELEAKIANDPHAVMCVTGLAFVVTRMIEARKLPRIETVRTVTLRDFRTQSQKLKSFDFASPDEQTMAQTALLMFEEGTYSNLPVLGVTAEEDCEFTIVRQNETGYIMNITPPQPNY